jgi:hypothetical protein
MPLDGKTFQQIQDALLDSFFNKSDLAQMVKRELGEDLDDIAGGENFKEITFNLLRWAETRDKVEILLEKAREYNPDNRSLLAVSEELPHTSETLSHPVAERTRRKIGMWLGLAVLLVVFVCAGKLIMNSLQAKGETKVDSIKLTETEIRKVKEFLTLADGALAENRPGSLELAEFYLSEAEKIAPDDQKVKTLRRIVNSKRK